MKIILSLVYYELLTSGIVLAYSKVSRNGQARASSADIAFTVSPVYVVTPKTIDLRPGEVINHPSTPKYSTLDEEMVAQLDAVSGRTRAQERFHPPASFEHVLAHSNALRPNQQPSAAIPVGSSSNNDVAYAKPVATMTFDYPSASFDAIPKPNNGNNPTSNSFSDYTSSKVPDSFANGPDDGGPPDQPSEFDSKIPTFDFDHPPKSVEFPGHYDHPFDDGPYSHGHEPYHEVIYDHIPEDHYHHYHHKPPTTTQEPEPMDQRLNKRPYSYYYIGKKLWYIPLYFSIYFIIYIAALVLKSVARHKINFPANLAAVAAGDNNARNVDDGKSGPGWMDYVVMVLEGIEKYGKKKKMS